MKYAPFLLSLAAIVGIAGCSEHPANAGEIAVPVSSASPASPSPSVTPAVLNSNEMRNGDFRVVLGADDIKAFRVGDGKEIFSIKEAAAARFRSAYPEQFLGGKAAFEQAELTYSAVSLAGPYLFLKEAAAISPQTSTTEKYYAVDLRDPAKRLVLTDLIAENTVAAGLLANGEVKAFLEQKESEPASLTDILKHLNKNAGEAREMPGMTLANCWFPTDILSSFAIKTGIDSKAVVELGVPCSSGMRDSELYPLVLEINESSTAVSGVPAVNAPAGLQEVTVTLRGGNNTVKK